MGDSCDASKALPDERQRLWAPWRSEYITRHGMSEEALPTPTAWRTGAAHDCFLCRAAAYFDDASSARRRQLVLPSTSEESLCLLNRYPYSNGHLLVCPNRHVARLSDLAPAERLAIMETLAYYSARMSEAPFLAHGFNIGVNLGAAAGAGVPGHLHWHLVPRWNGDHNFMPVIGATQVIPQSLEALWEALEVPWSPSAPSSAAVEPLR